MPCLNVIAAITLISIICDCAQVKQSVIYVNVKCRTTFVNESVVTFLEDDCHSLGGCCLGWENSLWKWWDVQRLHQHHVHHSAFGVSQAYLGSAFFHRDAAGPHSVSQLGSVAWDLHQSAWILQCLWRCASWLPRQPWGLSPSLHSPGLLSPWMRTCDPLHPPLALPRLAVSVYSLHLYSWSSYRNYTIVSGFGTLQGFVTFLATAITNKFHVKVFSSSYFHHAVISWASSSTLLCALIAPQLCLKFGEL